MIPYGRQCIDDDDIKAVVETLRSDYLTTGPKVAEFEEAVAKFVGVKYAVAVSSGTAALHTATHALGIEPGDEVIVPAMTFAASANCIVYQGGVPVFADVEPDTLLIDPVDVEKKISPKTKAIITVDYAGHPCDYDNLLHFARKHGLVLVDDACHSIGGSYRGCTVGTLGTLNTFSFHPVKNFTTGEGGMVTTDDHDLAQRMRIFRNHGIKSDHKQRAKRGSFFYEMVDLGYNYRITDFQCSLGLSQLQKLNVFVKKRQHIAAIYDKAFADIDCIQPQAVRPHVSHAYHLYVVQFDLEKLSLSRAEIFAELIGKDIGVNVHYIPVYWHPYYQRLGYKKGLCPVAETAYERLLSLPIFPMMTDAQIHYVIKAVSRIIEVYRK